MSTLLSSNPAALQPQRHRRSLSSLLEPLEAIATRSVNLLRNHGARFESNGELYELPRYLFIGPKGGSDPIRLGLFAALHGDEPEGAHALVHLVRLLEHSPELARGFCLFIYPVCNPTGYEDNTRGSRRGRDLNREFWNHSVEPEVQLLQSELYSHAFDGIISLHSDSTSSGAYGFVSGATLTKHLLEPALAAAHEILPRNTDPFIDGFHAENGIIRQGYRGVLSAPPKIRPRPFEIVFETPQQAPLFAQVQATVVALHTILTEYRKLISYAANL
jgi:hypothetical protein